MCFQFLHESVIFRLFQVILSIRGDCSVIGDILDCQAVLLHAGDDVFNRGFDLLFGQRVLVGIPGEGYPEAPAIQIWLVPPIALPCMPCPLVVRGEHRALSIFFDDHMVAHHALWPCAPVYAAFVAAGSMVEDDGFGDEDSPH